MGNVNCCGPRGGSAVDPRASGPSSVQVPQDTPGGQRTPRDPSPTRSAGSRQTNPASTAERGTGAHASPAGAPPPQREPHDPGPQRSAVFAEGSSGLERRLADRHYGDPGKGPAPNASELFVDALPLASEPDDALRRPAAAGLHNLNPAPHEEFQLAIVRPGAENHVLISYGQNRMTPPWAPDSGPVAIAEPARLDPVFTNLVDTGTQDPPGRYATRAMQGIRVDDDRSTSSSLTFGDPREPLGDHTEPGRASADVSLDDASNASSGSLSFARTDDDPPGEYDYYVDADRWSDSRDSSDIAMSLPDSFGVSSISSRGSSAHTSRTESSHSISSEESASHRGSRSSREA